jgi:hypothetical protein
MFFLYWQTKIPTDNILKHILYNNEVKIDILIIF